MQSERQSSGTNVSWEEERDGNNSSYRISPLKLPGYSFDTLL